MQSQIQFGLYAFVIYCIYFHCHPLFKCTKIYLRKVPSWHPYIVTNQLYERTDFQPVLTENSFSTPCCSFMQRCYFYIQSPAVNKTEAELKLIGFFSPLLSFYLFPLPKSDLALVTAMRGILLFFSYEPDLESGY